MGHVEGRSRIVAALRRVLDMMAFLLGLFVGAFFATLVMLISLYYRRV
jgi:hypothetical protein